MKRLWNWGIALFRRYESMVLYVFFGGLTTVVSFLTYFLGKWMFSPAGLSESAAVAAANVFSWILAVLFAFFTNRIWVFKSPTKGVKAFLLQMMAFFGARLFSFAIDMGIMLAGAKILETVWLQPTGFFKTTPEFWVKIGSNVVVLILNYLLSKFFVFHKKNAQKEFSEHTSA